MKHTSALITLVAALAAAPLFAQAADTKPSVSDQLKEKARLATICGDCAIVQGTKRETRKGEASGAGAIGGAVAGGVVGNKTTDSTIGTVGGAAVGGLLGNEIEKRVKRTKVYVTTVTMKDGSTRKFEAANDPKWAAGTVVEVHDGKLKKH